MKLRTHQLRLAPFLTAASLFFLNLSVAHAQGGVITSGPSTPEIDPSAVGGGLALLAGAALLLRSRRNP